MHFACSYFASRIPITEGEINCMPTAIEPRVIHRPAIHGNGSNSLWRRSGANAQSRDDSFKYFFDIPAQAAFRCHRIIRKAVKDFDRRRIAIPTKQRDAATLRAQIDRDASFPVGRCHKCLLVFGDCNLRIHITEVIAEKPPSTRHPPVSNGRSCSAIVGRQETEWPLRNPEDQSADESASALHKIQPDETGAVHPRLPYQKRSNIWRATRSLAREETLSSLSPQSRG